MFWIALAIIIAGCFIAYTIAHSRDQLLELNLSKDNIFRYNFEIEHISLNKTDLIEPSISDSLLKDRVKEIQIIKGLPISIVQDEKGFRSYQNAILSAKKEADDKACGVASMMMGLVYEPLEWKGGNFNRRFVSCKLISIEQI